MDIALKIDCIRKRYEHEPCLTKEEQARHAEVEIRRVMGDASIRKDAGSNGDESCVEILHRNAQYKEPIVDFEPSPTTIITEPVEAENNKQRER